MVLAAALIAGCTVVPDYVRPVVDVPSVFLPAVYLAVFDREDALPRAAVANS